MHPCEDAPLLVEEVLSRAIVHNFAEQEEQPELEQVAEADFVWFLDDYASDDVE